MDEILGKNDQVYHDALNGGMPQIDGETHELGKGQEAGVSNFGRSNLVGFKVVSPAKDLGLVFDEKTGLYLASDGTIVDPKTVAKSDIIEF